MKVMAYERKWQSASMAMWQLAKLQLASRNNRKLANGENGGGNAMTVSV